MTFLIKAVLHLAMGYFFYDTRRMTLHRQELHTREEYFRNRREKLFSALFILFYFILILILLYFMIRVKIKESENFQKY